MTFLSSCLMEAKRLPGADRREAEQTGMGVSRVACGVASARVFARQPLRANVRRPQLRNTIRRA
jgi:hypothetical protein